MSLSLIRQTLAVLRGGSSAVPSFSELMDSFRNAAAAPSAPNEGRVRANIGGDTSIGMTAKPRLPVLDANIFMTAPTQMFLQLPISLLGVYAKTTSGSTKNYVITKEEPGVVDYTGKKAKKVTVKELGTETKVDKDTKDLTRLPPREGLHAEFMACAALIQAKLDVHGDQALTHGDYEDAVPYFAPQKLIEALDKVKGHLDNAAKASPLMLFAYYAQLKTGYDYNGEEAKLKRLFQSTINNWFADLFNKLPFRSYDPNLLATGSTGLQAEQVESFSGSGSNGTNDTQNCVQVIRRALENYAQFYKGKEDIYFKASGATVSTLKSVTERQAVVNKKVITDEAQKFWAVFFRAVHHDKLQAVLDKMSTHGRALMKHVMTFYVHVFYHFLVTMGMQSVLTKEVLTAYDQAVDFTVGSADIFNTVKDEADPKAYFTEHYMRPTRVDERSSSALAAEIQSNQEGRKDLKDAVCTGSHVSGADPADVAKLKPICDADVTQLLAGGGVEEETAATSLVSKLKMFL